MALKNGNSIVRSGLLVHLDAANPKSYPGSGTIWTDLSGLGNNGNIINGATYNRANEGYFSFDGINDRIDINDFELGNIFSFGCWINTNTIQTAMLIVRGNSENSSGVYISLSSSDPGFLRGGGNNGSGWNSARISNIVINDSKWHFVFGVFNQTNNLITGYVDGIQGITITSTFNSNSYSPKNMKLSRNQVADIQFYQGIGSNYFVYNRALTTQEIQQNFNATRGRYGI